MLSDGSTLENKLVTLLGKDGDIRDSIAKNFATQEANLISLASKLEDELLDNLTFVESLGTENAFRIKGEYGFPNRLASIVSADPQHNEDLLDNLANRLNGVPNWQLANVRFGAIAAICYSRVK